NLCAILLGSFEDVLLHLRDISDISTIDNRDADLGLLSPYVKVLVIIKRLAGNQWTYFELT
ncbi:MAG: hypothetical protein WA446_11815, partial [Steroidobacteraceae bacterium]